ncbi:MAG: phosphoribosylformimino-5-aminoimidazole carboxamide ribotide isomerase [Eubacteriales bacterium]|nr:phosphoribosylformimino-5-aminoimidazole carboxamide ribotide isomerase [Eubacteriales bacterium]
MKFRPCIDIHNGKVKQIVGGSLLDEGDFAEDNFVSEKDGDFYANLYKKAGLIGGHIILLNPAGSEYYEEDVRQACLALKAYPGGLQIGGGMNADNAAFFLEQGATHIIVTSYVFKNGAINWENLKKMVNVTGKEHLVLDLSCRKKDGRYYIVTDRWQKFTDVLLNRETLEQLSSYCSEFLIHAVDVEGKASGIEEEIAALLGDWDGIPVTYAGGVGSFEDLRKLKELGKGKVDVTIGSALDLFGGNMAFEQVLSVIGEQ